MPLLREIALSDARIAVKDGESEFRIVSSEGKCLKMNASGYETSRFPRSELDNWIESGSVSQDLLQSENGEDIFRASPLVYTVCEFLERLGL